MDNRFSNKAFAERQEAASDTLYGAEQPRFFAGFIDQRGTAEVADARERLNIRDEEAQPEGVGFHSAMKTLYPNRETEASPQQAYDSTYVNNNATTYQPYRPTATVQPEIQMPAYVQPQAPAAVYGEDALMPSVNTMMHMPKEAAVSKTPIKDQLKAAKKGRAFWLSKKNKIALAIYSSVIVLLIVLVGVTTAMLSGLSASAGSIGTQYAATYQQEADILSELNQMNADWYRERAAEMGLAEAGAPGTVDLLPTAPRLEYRVNSGGFDRVLRRIFRR
jgi:hypothetical protein